MPVDLCQADTHKFAMYYPMPELSLFFTGFSSRISPFIP